MNRTTISKHLRESLNKLYSENEDMIDDKDTEDDKDSDGDKKSDLPLDKKDQTSIQNFLDKGKNPLAPSISQVMKKVTGENPNDASARSEFRKKIKQEDGLGLNDKEKDRVEVVLGIR